MRVFCVCVCVVNNTLQRGPCRACVTAGSVFIRKSDGITELDRESLGVYKVEGQIESV